jgi:2,3-bisphosphoglycerate-dependent phosphoglycerate mutase
LRHGQSLWNREKRFTGWTDISLSKKGILEAQQAAAILKKNHLTFDICYTSVLTRAMETVEILLPLLGQGTIPVHRSWRLNERHYGKLQGLTWWEAANQFGAKQVFIWQRHYTARPPGLTQDDPRFPGHDPLYANVDPQDLPLSESLADTQNRLLPYWQTEIFPALLQRKNILLIAHQNSLRSLLKYLSHLNDEDIKQVTVKTAEPIMCTFDAEGKFVNYSYIRWQPKIQDYTHRLLHKLLP